MRCGNIVWVLFGQLPKYLSIEARHLIVGMLEADPSKRLSLDAVSRHPWLNDTEVEGGGVGLYGV